MEAGRWTHRCPSCGRYLTVRRIYCAQCIAEYPERRRFLLSAQQCRLKKFRLPGTLIEESGLIVVIRGRTVCIGCGRRVSKKHRCYRSIIRMTSGWRNRKKLCRVCSTRRYLLEFPFIGERNRSMVCSSCLSEADKYEQVETR